MKDELREAAEIAGTRAFPAHPHFRGTGAALYIAGYEAGKRAERERIVERLVLIDDCTSTFNNFRDRTMGLVDELRAEPYTEGE